MNTSRTKTKERIDSWRKSLKLSLGRFIDFIRHPISITALCAILSLFTLVAYNIPVIKVTYANVESDFNGWLILATLVVLLLVVNFILYYILLYAGRIVGKVVIAFTLIGNAVAFIVALLAIKFFIGFQHSFTYCILGILRISKVKESQSVHVFVDFPIQFQEPLHMLTSLEMHFYR